MADPVLPLYKDILKHLRVLRNVSAQHKAAVNSSDIQIDLLTAYERGRLTRSSIRVGDNLEKLIKDHKQTKMALYFGAYIEQLIGHPGKFAKFGDNTWFDTWALFRAFIETEPKFVERIVDIVPLIVDCLDTPLSKVGSKLTFMRLSIG